MKLRQYNYIGTLERMPSVDDRLKYDRDLSGIPMALIEIDRATGLTSITFSPFV